MTPENFCYWLQGFIEIASPNAIMYAELEVIKEHLNLVFNKVTGQKMPFKPLDEQFCGQNKKLCGNSFKGDEECSIQLSGTSPYNKEPVWPTNYVSFLPGGSC